MTLFVILLVPETKNIPPVRGPTMCQLCLVYLLSKGLVLGTAITDKMSIWTS